MFYNHNPNDYHPALPGIVIKTLVFGEKSLLSEFRMDKGAQLPKHSHPHEQTGYLVSGRMHLTIGNETFEVEPGDSWCVHGDVVHQAEILENSVAVEVFSPVREDYLPYYIKGR
jgi:quercetin dioxygenase-like cupin family protein